MELFFSPQSIVPVLVALFIFSFLLSYLPMKWSSGKGFKTYPVVGSLPDLLMNRHRFLDWMTEVLATAPSNTATFWRPGKFNGVITADPGVVEYMLKTNFENYPKGKRFTYILSDFLGTGIFNSDGHLWKMQRKTASYEFNTKSLRNFAMENVTYEIQSRLLPFLDKAAQSGDVIDLQDILERFAFDNVCKLAFNMDTGCLGGGGDEFMASFEEAAMRSFDRFLCPFRLLWSGRRFLNIGSERRLKISIKTVHQFAEDIIRSRLEKRNSEEDSDKLDLLSRFIVGTENPSPEFLRDIVISFILAGRDTTSSALTWFFWLLSVNPSVEHNIRKELEAIRSRPVKGEAYEELRDMHYLHASISEAMRLYPPVPIDVKNCLRDDVLPDGTLIKKGWFLAYHTYGMGRMESIWGEDCLKYRPERWLDDGGACRMESPFRFPVFHGGPRVCLGKDMAYIQMKSIASAVLERFEIHVQDNDKCRRNKLSLTLRMENGLKVKVKQRRQ